MQPFPHMTVVENVVTGGLFGRRPRASFREVEEEAAELCRWVGLEGKENAYPRNLTVADQKKIEIARALAVKPKLLLLDEVMSGLTPAETAEAVKLVRQVRKRDNHFPDRARDESGHGDLGPDHCPAPWREDRRRVGGPSSQ